MTPLSRTSKIGKSLNSSWPRRSLSHLGSISLVAAKGRHVAAMEASAQAKCGLGPQAKTHRSPPLHPFSQIIRKNLKTLYATPLKIHPQQPTKYFLQPYLLNNLWKSATFEKKLRQRSQGRRWSKHLRDFLYRSVTNHLRKLHLVNSSTVASIHYARAVHAAWGRRSRISSRTKHEVLTWDIPALPA